MATSYSTPGVYVEEVSSGPRPIAAVGTSTAGFVGNAPIKNKHLNKAIPIKNWQHYVREFVGEQGSADPLSAAIFGFFQNGGGRCFVVNIGQSKSLSGGKKRSGIDVLESVDEIAIVAAPGFTDPDSYEALLAHCEKLKDRVAILDCAQGIDESRIEDLKLVATGGEGDKGLRPRQSDGGYGAFYFPWIKIKDPLDPKSTIEVPPSGHLAGVYARVDSMRGVHKAPANESIRGAIDLSYKVTHEEQGPLNTAGVNCIRFFAQEGIRIWGARTLAPAASEWRYVSVRRLFCMIEESIKEGTRWVVFEPNDEPLWKSIRRDVSAFLDRLWRAGAFCGATPQSAYFVQCDSETNPPQIIDDGQVVTLVGVAPVKPAEFIVFRIGQHVAEASGEGQGEGEEE